MPNAVRSHVEEDRPLARRIGTRLRQERHKAGLTQSALAAGRYTKAYVSALENGLVKPSIAALGYLADQLGVPMTSLIGDEVAWTRLAADVRLASGDWRAAADSYELLLADAGDAARADLLRNLAEAYCRMELAQDAVSAASEARTLYHARGDRAGAAWASYWLAFGMYELEQGSEARRILAGLSDELESGAIDDPDLRIRTPIARAMVESRDDEPERALAFLGEARASATGLDDRRRATYLFSLAVGYHEIGDLEAAVTTATQSLVMFKASESRLEVGSIENELALVYLALGNIERAREHAAAARAIFTEADNARWLAHTTETEAQVALASGDIALARTLAARAVEDGRRVGNMKATISALISLGRAHRACGEIDDARRVLEEAVAIARTHARRGQLQMALAELAEAVAEAGDLAQAFRLSQEALAVHRVAPANTGR